MAKPLDTLSPIGHSRWSQIAPFVGVCRETWRKLGKAGRAPRAIQLSPRCSVYRNEEVHTYPRDPMRYSCLQPVPPLRQGPDAP
jgi:predicted DNA-binding transcriptional regulator AlpA